MAFRSGGTPPEWFHFAGFLFRRQSTATDDPPSTVVGLPLWAPAAVMAVLPTIVLLRRLRRTHRDSTCQMCGYDLRATPGRCPECGTPAPVPVPADTGENA